MISINPLSEIEVNGYCLTLGKVYQKSEENSDTYTLIEVNHAINSYIYIPKDKTQPIEIESENTINTYNCGNCGNVKTTKNYYGCTWSEDNSIRNKDIRLCKDCKNELETTYKQAVESSLNQFLVDII